LRNKKIKPYKYSKKIGRYISTSKTANREFYYSNLKKINPDFFFDPHSTYGKYIMRRITPLLKSYRKNLQQLESYSLKVERTEENLEDTINKAKSTELNKYVQNISVLKDNLAHTKYPALKKYNILIYIISALISVIIYVYSENVITTLFFSFVIYLLVKDVLEKTKNFIKLKFEKEAVSKYRGLSLDILQNNAEKKINKELDLTKGEVIKLSKICDIINFEVVSKIETLLNDTRVKFILSDQFYNSTDWISIRNKKLNSTINKCNFCDSENDITVDHIKPRSKFPELALSIHNTQLLCRSCNSAKGNRIQNKKL
jgi:hypothetical protein